MAQVEIIKEIEEDKDRNLKERLKYIDWIVEQIRKDHKEWLRFQVKWLKESHRALIELLRKDPKIRQLIIKEQLTKSFNKR